VVCKDEMWKKREDSGSEWSGGAKDDVGEETIEKHVWEERERELIWLNSCCRCK